MAYTALYRKFRPDDFEDVKGQDHIVVTLKNQIQAKRVGHAYLFCGTRGTGKTSVAKVFAKAVNCENPVNGSPCQVCDSCRRIADGASMNVIEIDAASNNGVDNIRQIKEEVAYSPSEGSYKVYIIDEVHMLSIGAFNALLKTLEEPPAYVIFILATTEVHKIPVTILSRCQRYDFKRITIETIAGRLTSLMEQEQVEVEEKAIRYIAKAADGSMRDALSLLDQCIAFYMNEKLTYDHVLEILGAVDIEVFYNMLDAIHSQDVTAVISSLEDLIMEGRELGQFVNDFTWYLRNLLLVQSADNMEEVLDMSAENISRLKEQAGQIDSETLMRYIRIFSELSGQIKYASQKRIMIEVALIKLCRPQMETDLSSVLERLKAVEQQVKEGVPVKASAPAAAEPVKKSSPAPKALPRAIPEDIQKVVADWRQIINTAPVVLNKYLRSARLSLGQDGRLQIVLADPMAEGYVSDERHKKDLIDLIAEKTGKAVELDIRVLEENRAFEDSFIDIEKKINMELTIED